MMKEKIKEICKRIENENNVRILFAVENGSRAWRMDSQDSDFDVRFVFVRLLSEYIQINKPEEVITACFDREGKSCFPQGALIDISGFDIFKFVKMLSLSNPTTIEWLTSDIIYYGKQNEIFKQFATKHFNRTSLYRHYKSMCRNNYLKYLKSGEMVTYKKYLYAYRGLINAKWVVHKKTVPPIIFAEALQKIKKHIPEDIQTKIQEMISLKSQGKEKDKIKNIAEMDNYIEQFLKDDSEAPTGKSSVTLSCLNEELRKIVLVEEIRHPQSNG